MPTLLGTANIAFWQIFVGADMLAVGNITTSLHALFAVRQLLAAVSTSERKALAWIPKS